jgi:hypothetical protein
MKIIFSIGVIYYQVLCHLDFYFLHIFAGIVKGLFSLMLVV